MHFSFFTQTHHQGRTKGMPSERKGDAKAGDVQAVEVSSSVSHLLKKEPVTSLEVSKQATPSVQESKPLDPEHRAPASSPSSETSNFTPETPKQAPATTSEKIKRSKSFTGCFTCRTRKIRCDLTKPLCTNCQRSDLVCSGYDIKLKWSRPIEFRPGRSGGTTSSQVSFKEEAEEGPPGGEFFQRRNVAFVAWSTPYETYEEMDRDLLILHNSGKDSMVSREGNTKLLGPFGVFKKRKGKIQKNLKPENLAAMAGVTVHIPSKSITNSGVNTGKNSVANSSANSEWNSPFAPDQVWLSNELRDDALLTAAALNGDTQFLEFMNRFSMPNFSGAPTPKHSTNQNELLNLVFHRNSMQQNNATPMSSIGTLPPPTLSSEDILTEQGKEHLYYSNYNNYYYNNPYQLNENLEIHLHASSGREEDGDEEESTDLVEGSHGTEMPTSIMCIVQNPLQSELGFDLSIPPKLNPKFGLPTSALQVQPLTRYLLNYYITEVADLMTVIPLTENPWKTIYFPRALMAIGELSALGQTSTAKNALLNALLAVSAFNLQSKFEKNSEAMRYYLNLGIRLRNQASLFIKRLLHSPNPESGIEHCVTNEKYKDVLCAVMTMISVDLVWGTMQDTSFYITWCGKVIQAKMRNKKKLTSKARILHRIFSSLKLIQDSTCLDVDTITAEFDVRDGGYDVNGDRFATTSGKNSIDFIVNANVQNPPTSRNTSPRFHNKKLINTKKNDENFATDALYGLPNSLILLFGETVQLLRTKIYHQEVYQRLPDDFTKRVNDLSKRLLNWKLDWNLYKESDASPASTHTSPLADAEGNLIDPDLLDENINIEQIVESVDHGEFVSPMHEATYHHIYSFYHALNIYFNRLLKEVTPAKLQTKVARTLNHLNAIQRLIAQGDAAIIPLFWQGFIAGCEATSQPLQLGFKKWGGDIAQYLGSYWGARQIMLEVWRRKRMNESSDDWVSVIRDWEMNLMLN